MWSAPASTRFFPLTRTQLNSSSILSRAFCASLALAVVPASESFALPTGAQVQAGDISISQPSATQLVVNQGSDRAVINWQSFDILSGEATRFNQPSASSIALNRVTNGSPTQILGSLSANGRLVIVNASGVFFGLGSKVDVGSLVATTADIPNANFMAGSTNFTIPGRANASIINKGTITAADGGLVALVAPGVRNDGVIQANLGTVTLGSAQTVSVDFYGDNLYGFSLGTKTDVTPLDENGNAMKNAVDNQGHIIAQSGTVLLTANAAKSVVDNVVNNDGIIEATSAHSVGGTIVLDGGSEGNVRVAGTLDASGKTSGEKGGHIQVTGETIALEGATLDASGDIGGGEVDVGGLLHGADGLAHAQTVSMDAGSSIDVSAITQGDGGTAVLWSDVETDFAGSILARGAATGGNGGFIETSGATLNASGTVDASAANGDSGTWLLDPFNITVDGILAGVVDFVLDTGTNVTIDTGGPLGSQSGNLEVAHDIVKAFGSNANLNLRAASNITVDSGVAIKSTHNKLNVTLTADTANNGGYIQLQHGSSILSDGGNITLQGGAAGGFAESHNGTLGGISIGEWGVGGATVDAGGGNITMSGAADSAVADVTHWDGIDLFGNSSVTTSGSGKVALTGLGSSLESDTGGNSEGIYFDNGSNVSSVNGDITIAGTGRGTSKISSFPDYGIELRGNNTIATTGNGNISITGTGSNIGTDVWGITNTYAGGVVTIGGASDHGNITLNGSSISLDANIQTTKDVAFNSAGAVTLTGGSISGHNVTIDPTDVALSGETVNATGAISITATDDITVSGGGLSSTGGDITLDSNSDSTATGAIALSNTSLTSHGHNIVLGGGATPATGAAVGGAANADGVLISGTTLDATGGNGNISILGDGYTGTTASNVYGVGIVGGSTVKTDGTGTITITGIGGGTGASGTDFGVLATDINTRISSVGGAITITGTGGLGSGNTNAGTVIESGAAVLSQPGRHQS